MEIFLLLLILSTSIAWLSYSLIWHWRGKTRPILAGSICLTLGLIVAVVPTAFFGVSYSAPSYGIILLVPTWGPLFLGIVSFVFGIIKGRQKAFSNLKKVTKLVFDDPDRQP
jgi:hypothetical protein